MVTAEGVAGCRVTGVAAPPGRDARPARATVFFADATAARPAGSPDRFAFVGVIAEPGVRTGELTDRVRDASAALAPAVTLGAADTPEDGGVRTVRAKLPTAHEAAGAGTPEVAGPLADATLLFGSMGGVGAFVAVCAIAGAFGLSALGRAREFTLSRAAGATGGQIRRMVVGEALPVAPFAAVPGVALGVPLAHTLREALVERAGIPAEFTVSVDAFALLGGTGVGVLRALLAATAASRYAGRTRPIDALPDVGEPRRPVRWPRILLAVPASAGAGVLFVPNQRIGGEVGVAFQVLVLLLPLAVLPLAPSPTRWLERAIGAFVALVGRTTGWLAHADSAAATRRMASGAAALMPSVAMAGDVLLVTTVLRETTREPTVLGSPHVLRPTRSPRHPPAPAPPAARPARMLRSPRCLPGSAPPAVRPARPDTRLPRRPRPPAQPRSEAARPEPPAPSAPMPPRGPCCGVYPLPVRLVTKVRKAVR